MKDRKEILFKIYRYFRRDRNRILGEKKLIKYSK